MSDSAWVPISRAAAEAQRSMAPSSSENPANEKIFCRIERSTSTVGAVNRAVNIHSQKSNCVGDRTSPLLASAQSGTCFTA